jgi:predicted RecB family nuclease
MHEYIKIIDHKAQENQHQFISNLRQKNTHIQPYSIAKLKNGADFLTNVKLQAEELEATCGLLTKVSGRSSLGNYHYEPTIFVGTHKISVEQKLELLFVGHVLGLVQNKPPIEGKIIDADGKSHRIKLKGSDKTVVHSLEKLQEWATTLSVETPTIILNKHCPTCQFRDICRKQAEQEDNLSLLDRVTPKVIRKYEKKGIFTIKQLSYLYKPRRRKKRAKNHTVAHKLELQALAIRTGKIYLQDLPDLLRQPTELFLDIEGIPDQQAFYLIGLLVCEADSCTYHSFWADTQQDETGIWTQFLEMVDEYPDAPIYHYGSYEPRAIAQMSRRYESDIEALKTRLVNVNTDGQKITRSDDV